MRFLKSLWARVSMWLGIGLRLDQQGAGSSSAGGSGTALSAPTLTRTSSATTYPPLVDFNRPIDWIDGDQAVMQRSQDPTFATGVSEAVQTILAATTTYNFGLSSIASGSWFMRMAAWRGTRPASGSLNWSNITNVGDTVAPTITSSATQAATSISLTADELVTWAIVGGADQALWQLSGSTLSLVSSVVTQSVHSVQVQATDYAGNTTTQTITNTIDITPTLGAAFTFTDIPGGATASTGYPFTYTVAGLGSGVTVNYTSTVAVTKNGSGSATSGTCTNGDVLAGSLTSSATDGAAVSEVLTVGAGSDTFSVTTGFTPAALWTASESGDWWDTTDLSTMFQDTAGTTPVTAAGQQVKRWVGKKNGTVLLPAGTNGPTLQLFGSEYYLRFLLTNSEGFITAAPFRIADVTTGEWTAAVPVAHVDDIQVVLGLGYAGGSPIGAIVPVGSGQLNVYGYAGGSATADSSAAGAYAGNTVYRAMGVRTSTAVESFVNNTSNGATTVSGTADKTTCKLEVAFDQSSGLYYSMTIWGGIITIGRALTSTERGNLNSWLVARSS